MDMPNCSGILINLLIIKESYMTNTAAKSLFPRSAFVGFDSMFDDLDRVSRNSGDSFPPHNIIGMGGNHFLIELAIAGFNESELDIELKNRTLTIRGQHEDRGREYIHKGISTKKFEKQFRLSEYVEVTGADFRNGLLAVKLEVVIPDSQKPRKISINSNEENNNAKEQITK
jgi:molecular chaperone IbpA